MEYKVNLKKFSGPLDVLLHLIEEKKLAVEEISLARVADQFLAYFQNLPNNGLAAPDHRRILADFLVVASRLILIKSRSLLPNLVLTSEEEGDIKDLEERLKKYQRIKIWGKELGRLVKNGNRYFDRESFYNPDPIFLPPENISAADLAEIYKNFLKTLPQAEKPEERNLRRIITLDQKIKELRSRINSAVEASFNEISKGVKTKLDVILNFLAILALFRSRILEISQNETFGDIRIKQCAES